MLQFLIRHCIKNYQNTGDPQVRRSYGAFAGLLGICCNMLLAALKLALALMTNSLAVAADSFNNLSDAASSIVTYFGFRLSGRPPDEQHPFGHGRVEYVAGMIVALLVVAVGLQFIRSSIERIITPEAIRFHWIAFGLLAASLLVKLWMFAYNRRIGNLIDSEAVKATAFDSLADLMTTALTLISLILARFTALPLDGWFGLAIGGFVVAGGVKIVRDTLSPLLGQSPDPDLVKELKNRLTSYREILGVHDIIINNYGPGRYIASAHAEVDFRIDPFVIHDILDRAEKEIGAELTMHLTLHYDPIDPSDPELRRLTGLAETVLGQIDPVLHLHDLRLEHLAEGKIKLSFDVVIPRGYTRERRDLRRTIITALRRANPDLVPVIEIEHSFI